MAETSGYAVTKGHLQFTWSQGNWILTDFVPESYVSTGSGAPPPSVFSQPLGYQSP